MEGCGAEEGTAMGVCRCTWCRVRALFFHDDDHHHHHRMMMMMCDVDELTQTDAVSDTAD